ncbi:hypothetical protein K4K60_000445 [Colletotrichum sp. SAR11_57]|nr:hypothetical protein K4K60_000445 [Colletotrichum sp. SAR11_57]
MSDSTELATIRAKLKERERTSEYFNQIWEDEALPRLKETMVKGNITDYNISIQADYSDAPLEQKNRMLHLVTLVITHL